MCFTPPAREPVVSRLTRRHCLAASLAATVGMPWRLASAQAYPSRAVRLVVPYASGGPTDLLARALAQRLSETLGQAVIVDNRPGGGGILGVDLVAKSPADGHTLLFTASGTLVMNPALNPKLPYKVSDLAPVSSAATYDMFLAVSPKLGFTSLADMLAYARRHPGKLSFGSAGSGTSNHLAGELLKKMAKVDLLHIPYKGNAAAMTDVMGGNISMMFDLPATTLPHAQSGNVQLLATTGRLRNPLASQVPTFIEGGVPGYEVTSWFGVFAPARTPNEILGRLSQQIVAILGDATISAKLAGQGYQVSGCTPERLAEMVSTDSRLWTDLVREANLKMD